MIDKKIPMAKSNLNNIAGRR